MMDWQELESECRACKLCSLSETRTKVVFGVGNRDAEVMLVGEGPGADEDRLGEPFVGRAGKLLDDMMKIIGLDRDLVYIANVVKCRPPNNRDPLNLEQAACRSWLDNQIALIKPKVIVTLGRIAGEALLNRNERMKITAEHGNWFELGDAKVMVLYHPSYLLRDPRRRPETFVDLKELQRTIRELCPLTFSKLNYDV